MKPISRIDFETRSPVDLRTCGAYVYFEHPDAKVLIASYKYEGETRIRRWRIGQPCPPDLEAHIRAGGIIRAFNAAFETLCFEWLAANCGWPLPDYEQFVCTQSFARAMALPASLDQLGTALQLDVVKDKDGARLMRKFSIPAKNGRSVIVTETCSNCSGGAYLSKKGNLKTCKVCAGTGVYEKITKVLQLFVEPEDDPEEFEKYHLYCDRDVETEEAADVKLVPLSDAEQAVWHLSEKINRRGLRIDVQSAQAAIRLADKAQAMINAEVAQLTDGAVQRVTEVAKLIAWAGTQGVLLDSAAKGDISDALNLTDLPPVVRKVLELRLEGAKSSVTKIKGFMSRMNKDGRVRGCYTYHGANTGRWVSTGVNFANLPRPRGVFEDAHLEPETLYKAIRMEDPKLLIDLFGDELGRPMHLLSDAIRGLIWAAPGHRFIQADYSGIEGAVAAFLADETWKLEGMFEILADPKNNPDMYRQTAARIMNMTTDIITKKHFYRQAIGKTSELALGFGGGVSAFVTMANNYRVDLDSIYEPVWAAASDEDKEYAEKRYRFNLARKQGGATEISKEAWMACQIIVKGWRASNPAIAQAWRDMEEAARSAIENPGTVFAAAKCKLIVKMGYMWMQLPSGRCLCFPSPKLSSQVWVQIKIEDGSFADAEVMEREIAEKLEAQGKAKIQGDTSPGISFLGVDSKTKKFIRKRTYGGDLFQSAVQASARDILVNGMLKAEEAGYPVVLHTYDEMAAEVPNGFGSVKEFERIICQLPDWAEGLPLGAEGYEAKRYKK